MPQDDLGIKSVDTSDDLGIVPISSSSGLLKPITDLYNKLNTPLINIRSGGLKTATDEFAQEHPIIGGIGNFATDTLSSLTSPLSLGLGALTAGSSIAEKAGAEALAKGLEVPGRLAAGGMIAHGGYNAVKPSSTIPERLGGIAEAGLGALGVGKRGEIKPSILGEEAPIVEKSLTPKLASFKPEQAPKLNPIPDNINPKLNISPSAQPQIQHPAVVKLVQAINDIKPMTSEQKSIYSAERSERLANMKATAGEGEAGAFNRLGKLKGEMEKVTFEPIKLDQTDVDGLFDIIKNHPASIGFNEAKAITGLGRLLNGQLPRESEVSVLQKVFGPDLKPPNNSTLTGRIASNVVNIPRTIMSSYDLSAPFRQGLGLIHRKEFWTSFDDMFKSLGTEGYKGVMESIESNPNFKLGQDSGLSITDMLSQREERFTSNWAEKLPGVKMSERAYTGFLNKLRMDTFDSLINKSTKASESLLKYAKTPKKLQAAKLANPNLNPDLAESLAQFVNTATGRGSLGSLEKHADILNNVLFSPRLMASRVKMLNPITYLNPNTPAVVRKEYLKSLLAIASASTMVTELGKFAGGTVDNNPTSADFRKLKLGNTRLDPGGGFQQYITLVSKLATGEQTSTTSGDTYNLGHYGRDTRGDVVRRFGQNKLAPVYKFVADWLFQTEKSQFSITDEAKQMVLPMMVNDIVDLYNEDPTLLPLAIPAAFGAGLQTYR